MKFNETPLCFVYDMDDTGDGGGDDCNGNASRSVHKVRPRIFCDAEHKTMNAKTTTPNPKPLDWKAAAGVVLAVAAVGAVVYWAFFSEPAPAWRVRWSLHRYLKKQSHKSDFRVDFKFPPKAAMAKAPRGASANSEGGPPRGELTKMDFDTLREEYMDFEREALLLQRDLADRQTEIAQHQGQLAAQEKQLATASTNASANRVSVLQSNLTTLRNHVAARQKELPAKQQALAAKEQALAPMVSDLWAFQRTWASQPPTAATPGTNDLAIAQAELTRETRRKFSEANSYEAMYELIGEQLWVAARLFTSANLQHQRVALAIARQAATDASRITEDSWLAARIYEAYLWPHLDAADYSNWRAPLSIENVLNDCAAVFRNADEPSNVIRTYQLLLAKARNPQRADWARIQLAQAHENSGDLAQAVRYLKEVKATNDFRGALRRLPWLEQRAKAR